jgi:urocanate hydratase
MNNGKCLAVEVDPWRIQRHVETGYCDVMATDLDKALGLLDEAISCLSVGLLGNIAEVLPELLRRGIVPDMVADQTSAHDFREGYIPIGYPLEDATELRKKDPDCYDSAVLGAMVVHVQPILDLQTQGSICFDYGHNLPGQIADHRGMTEAFNFPGFVPDYIRPLFSRSAGPHLLAGIW